MKALVIALLLILATALGTGAQHTAPNPVAFDLLLEAASLDSVPIVMSRSIIREWNYDEDTTWVLVEFSVRIRGEVAADTTLMYTAMPMRQPPERAYQ